eukprot:2806808-Rhodomonas_salina.2
MPAAIPAWVSLGKDGVFKTGGHRKQRAVSLSSVSRFIGTASARHSLSGQTPPGRWISAQCANAPESSRGGKRPPGGQQQWVDRELEHSSSHVSTGQRTEHAGWRSLCQCRAQRIGCT